MHYELLTLNNYLKAAFYWQVAQALSEMRFVYIMSKHAVTTSNKCKRCLIMKTKLVSEYARRFADRSDLN